MGDDINNDGDLGWSKKKTALTTSESEWAVGEHLRLGHYQAVKRGRRTIIIPATVKEYWATLPIAKLGTNNNSESQPRKKGCFARNLSAANQSST